jgi:undecaprenyl diphosphate synthase
MSRIPAHIAIIMDGNGRWAARRSLPRQAGHIEGAKKFQEIALFCQEIGVKYFTVYAFSTENWKRPPEEVSAIMHLFRDYLLNAKTELLTRNIHINIIGDTEVFQGSELGDLIAEVTSMNLNPDALQANIAMNYGGRAELVRAANRVFSKKSGPITEEDIGDNLYTAGQPDPELVIRTSGEYRLSGFMLWQCSYSELVFTDCLWPDFSKEELLGAIAEFQSRERRFGGVKK